jgi:hypothetical protein
VVAPTATCRSQCSGRGDGREPLVLGDDLDTDGLADLLDLIEHGPGRRSDPARE